VKDVFWKGDLLYEGQATRS